MTTEVKVPDIGDFTDVPVISVLVNVGDTIAEEDPLIELESDKATMEVPSSHAGTVKEIKVAEGDKRLGRHGDPDHRGRRRGGRRGQRSARRGKGRGRAESREVRRVRLVRWRRIAAAGDGLGRRGADLAATPRRRRGSGDRSGLLQGPCLAIGARLCAPGRASTSAHVNGSGRKGRILREDVEKALKSQAAPAAAGGAPAQGGMGIPPIPAAGLHQVR